MKRFRWYVGAIENKFVAFTSVANPTYASHGTLYRYVVGPFRTKRAAMWAQRFGWSNPHFTDVDAAELFATRTTGIPLTS